MRLPRLFTRELSILAVQSKTGERAFYPLVQNEHRNGILRTTLMIAVAAPLVRALVLLLRF